MKKPFPTATKLAIKISAAISGIMILLFVSFTFILRWNLTKQKSKVLRENCKKITDYLTDSQNKIYELEEAFLDLSWFIDYAIYEKNGEIKVTTNKYIPILPVTMEKTVHYVEKAFYLDGNLDLLYLTKQLDSNHILQLSIDIENDSASKMIYSMPKIIPIMMLPIILLTFLVLLFFIKRNFEQEHNFSANVSHELMTPVNAILGHSKMLERWGKNEPEQLEKSLKIITAEAKSMESTITNLLQITKLEKKMIDLSREEIQLDDFYDDLKNEFKYEQNLEIDFSPKAMQLVTNRNLLHQIFVIVISNSLKFCPKPCKIHLSSRQEKHKTVLEITDNGSGFAPEIIPHIFDRFYRGDAAHSRSKGGAGLGLSIAKSIATVLNCKIEAENAADGGACIRLVF